MLWGMSLTNCYVMGHADYNFSITIRWDIVILNVFVFLIILIIHGCGLVAMVSIIVSTIDA